MKKVPWPENYIPAKGDWQHEIKTSSEHKFQSHLMEIGQAILFSGSSQWHYRDVQPVSAEHPSCFCNLIFFHFTPAGRREIVSQKNWSRLFGIPELDALVSKRATDSERHVGPI